ncbi:hypothetical protein Forpe1208_v017076 [Fusarium oxysporum f. sp. rapae]|uniref:Uncharacterized protein n=1 Tax=Fusarium oxysporum f. sp. rapae TaxID=485398 RepID=A0A8J5TMH7_FUSOX|nr:hypothetical protein Forpe1208_v017163 [Fusarium oxysporum f. sp. rapae]KAG7402550.1 hypothetical protein Forpe1208_v017076 [Fusarium oxysporum f. sp. rapae]
MSSHGNCNVINDDENDKFHVDMEDHNGIFDDDSYDYSIHSDDTNDDAILEVRKLLDSVHYFTIELLEEGVPHEDILYKQQEHLKRLIDEDFNGKMYMNTIAEGL